MKRGPSGLNLMDRWSWSAGSSSSSRPTIVRDTVFVGKTEPSLLVRAHSRARVSENRFLFRRIFQRRRKSFKIRRTKADKVLRARAGWAEDIGPSTSDKRLRWCVCATTGVVTEKRLLSIRDVYGRRDLCAQAPHTHERDGPHAFTDL